jgi:RNA polymerase sigma-70 factor (ECF subfamily)
MIYKDSVLIGHLEPNNIELFIKAKEGNQHAFSMIMDKYRSYLYFNILKKVQNHHDAEDILMITFSKAFKNIQYYDEKYDFKNWIFKISINTCLDFLRKKKATISKIDETIKEPNQSTYIYTLVIDKSANPLEKLINNQKVIEIRNVLNKLPRKYIRVLELLYFEELSYEQIARKLELPLGTVKIQIYRAKSLLCELYYPSKNIF